MALIVPFHPAKGAVTSGNSGTKCWGTNLTGGYVANTDTSLRSPVINLAGVTSAKLSFSLAIDANTGHTLTVKIIEQHYECGHRKHHPR